VEARAAPEQAEELVRVLEVIERREGNRYEDTNRYYRGRVLAQLREDTLVGERRGLHRRGPALALWCRGDPQKDGLAVVAEERAAYGSYGTESEEARLRLR